VLNSVVKISMMFTKCFEYYTIILGGGCFFVDTLYFLAPVKANNLELNHALVETALDRCMSIECISCQTKHANMMSKPSSLRQNGVIDMLFKV